MAQYNKNEKNKSNNNRPAKPEPHPVAVLLRDNISEQMLEFLRASHDERLELSKDLFKIDMFPAGLTGCEGAENYNVFQIERTTRMNKDIEVDEIPRMSTAIILIDKKTGKPAFYLNGYITPRATASITIYVMGENGPDYKSTVRWSSREYGF